MQLYCEINGTLTYPVIEGSSISKARDLRVMRSSLRVYASQPFLLGTSVLGDAFGIDASPLDVITVKKSSDNSVIYRGIVIAVNRSVANRGKTKTFEITIESVDYSYLLSHPPNLITKFYSGTDRVIIQSIITDSGLGSYIDDADSTIEVISSDLEIGFYNKTPQECFEEIKQQTGGIFFVLDNDLHYISEDNAAAASWNINNDTPNDSTTFAMLKLDVSERWENPINRVIVIGGLDSLNLQISDTYDDTSSQSTYSSAPGGGIYASLFENNDLTTQGLLDEAGSILLEENSTPTLSARIETFTDGLEVGREITVTDQRFALSAEPFIVRDLTIQQIPDGINSPTARSRYTASLGASRPSMEDYLRRLRRRFNNGRRINPIAVRCVKFDHTSNAKDLAVENLTVIQDDKITKIVGAWVWPSAISGSQTIMRFGQWNGAIYPGWRFEINSSGFLECRVLGVDNPNPGDTLTQTAVANTLALTATRWYHVCAFMRGSSAPKLFVNGVETGYSTSSTSGSGLPTTGVILHLGRNRLDATAGGTNRPFSGWMAQAFLWRNVISDSFLRQISSSPNVQNFLATIESSNVVFKAPLDELDDGNDAPSFPYSFVDKGPQANYVIGWDANRTPEGGLKVWVP